ncbi:hypothetical protein BI364_06800 [Acidihalobacter yilgarnensis]|uniref:Uncharacterized protein n=2 Tax=Acidihalobacter yilgarnensis TaxID=2819280 RepID=A0A1D8IMK6_9GAMM|nr:hypothetical protein BI364_06800 [Acidihalobacter yilgarnensis]
MFGSAMALAITVDNGGSSYASQSYQFSNITGINATAVGGSFSYNFTAPIYNLYYRNGAPFMTTDTAGVPTLHLGDVNNVEAYFEGYYNPPDKTGINLVLSQFDNQPSDWSQLFLFSVPSPADGAIPLGADVNPPTSANTPYNLVGARPGGAVGGIAVPAPPSWLMMLTGFGILFPIYRQHIKPKRKNADRNNTLAA